MGVLSATVHDPPNNISAIGGNVLQVAVGAMFGTSHELSWFWANWVDRDKEILDGGVLTCRSDVCGRIQNEGAIRHRKHFH